MKKFLIATLFVAVAVSLTQFAPAQEGSYKVIAHPDVEESALSRSQVSSLLLKKSNRWPDSNQQAKPIDLDSSSSVREAFSQDIHRRSISNIKNYWQRQIFSGRDLPPPEAKSDAEVLRYVQDTPGAIGYVSSSASTSGVKVLRVAD